MSNILDNGTVLPFGLMSGTSSSMNDAFKKTYQNTALRVGVVIQSYPIDDENNLNKVVPEYDVMTFEQNEDQGSTTITYKHCTNTASFGSIADFFEANLRKLEKKTTKGVTPTPAGQNGAIVLLLCLNGMSETGIIIGSLAHPDRPTTLVDGEPHLEGEYNGVRIVVNSDGSTSLTFKGATDNDGKIIDSSQGPTVIKIETDGSFQVNHEAITLRLAKDGTTTLNAKKDINIITETNLSITAKANVNVKCVDVNVDASGKANVKTGADATIDVGGNCNVKTKADASVDVGGNCDLKAKGKVNVKAKEIDLNGELSGITTMNSHQGVIDLITGVPVQPSLTVKADV